VSSIFARIAAGEIPAWKLYEDEQHLAFLDIQPVRAGHTLVIPKREVDYLFDLEADEQAALWNVVRLVERRLKIVTKARRVIVHVQGYEIPHAHVHLIPTKQVNDWPMPARQTPDTAFFTELVKEFKAVE
jgi:histidine triad (HIT) family protein